MASYGAQSGVEIRQQVGVVQPGGIVYGVYYAPGSDVPRPSVPPEPPDSDTIRKYLEAAASQKIQPEIGKTTDEVSQSLETLWSIPFRALGRADAEPQELFNLVDQVMKGNRERNGYQRLLLLADAGMGKTPALKSLVRNLALHTLQALQDQQSEDGSASTRCIIPIYVNLAHIRLGQDLAATLSNAFNECIGHNATDGQALLGLLNTRKYTCFILADDLDQLLSRQEQGTLLMLQQFTETYREHRYVITFRATANRQQLGSLDELYLAPLTDEEVRAVLGEGKKSEFDALHQASQKLSHNRSALEQYIRRKKSIDLFESKGRFLDILIGDRLALADKLVDADDGVTLARDLLESLAARMRLDRTYGCSERSLMVMITEFLEEWREAMPWRKVASSLAEGEFLRHDQSRKLWSFCDRCDEVYFAASAVINGRVDLSLLMQEASDVWWRDIFEVLVGLHQNPQGLLLDLIDRDALVAAHCLQYASASVREACSEALVDGLVEEFWRGSSRVKVSIAGRFGEHKHQQAGQALLQILHREWSSMVLLATLEALAAWGRLQADAKEQICEAERLMPHVLDPAMGVVGDLLDWCWSGQLLDDWVEPIRFLWDKKRPLRARALVALGLGMKRVEPAQPELLRLLKSRSTDEELAWCAVEALASLQVGQEELCDWAKKTTKITDQSLKSQQQQARAIYLLGRVGKDSDTELLLRSALKQQNVCVRGYAVSAIARLDLIDARAEIEALMSSETDPWVLRQAAEALGQIGNLETLPILQRHLRSQQASSRRSVQRAINEILERNAMPPLLEMRS